MLRLLVLLPLPRLLQTLLALMFGLARVLTHSFLLLFAAIVAVASISLILLSLEIAMLGITCFKLINALLQLPEVQFQVLIDFAHFEILLFEILTALSDLLKLLIELDLSDTLCSNFLLRPDQLLRYILKLLL